MPYIALCLLFSTAVLLSIATPLAVPPSTITSPTTLLDSSWTRRVDPPPTTTEFGSSSLSSWGTHHWNPGRRRASQKNKRTPGLDGATSSSSGGFAVHENIVSTFSPPSTDLSSSTSSSPSSTPSLTSLSPTSSGSATAAPASAIPLPPSVPWPQPFDQSLSYSLTGSCVAFLATWLESEDMRGNKTGRMPGVAGNVGKCARPFGLLMTSSSGWASLTRNETLLTAALSQICHPPPTEDTSECTDYYRSLAVSIQKSSNCGTDLKNKNPVALEALYGFQSYDMLQRAACLQNNATGAYCYVEAMSTSSPPDDGYLYYLPIGISLPSTNRATCSSCSARLVNLFTETMVQAITTATSLGTTGTSGNIGSVSAGTTTTTAAAGEGYYYSYAPVMEGALANATTILKQTCGSTFAGQITTSQAHVSSAAVSSSPTWLRTWSSWATCSALSVSLVVPFLFFDVI